MHISKIRPKSFYIGLMGKGLQFVQAPRKVWCLVGINKDVRTMADFPDGTPCGKGKYCLRGDCLTLTCNKQTIVASPGDCPTATVTRKDPITKREIALAFNGVWTDWEAWSECIASDCGNIGIKERNRTCKESSEKIGTPLCLGAKTQRSECIKQC
jgi:hypothetical protein